MSSGQECFAVWAPSGDFWSQWAKPVVFASATGLSADAPLAVPSLDGVILPGTFDPAGIVIDLPGDQAVMVGLALAGRGYRPVPLFNGTSGPNAVVPVDPIERALFSGADILNRAVIAPDARPAFLVDANRNNLFGADEPGRYDNRWIVLPQDFPSGATLLSRGIKDVTVVRQRSTLPDQDLSVVLQRWRDAGVRLHGVALETRTFDESLSLTVPSYARRVWYAAIALMGLRRSNVGGFGAMVPEATQRSGFYG